MGVGVGSTGLRQLSPRQQMLRLRTKPTKFTCEDNKTPHQLAMQTLPKHLNTLAKPNTASKVTFLVCLNLHSSLQLGQLSAISDVPAKLKRLKHAERRHHLDSRAMESCFLWKFADLIVT